MKPSSVLILDQDGVILLHRNKSGWHPIGQADPSGPGFDEDMRAMRQTAIELSANRFATRLIIPNSQILYRELDLPLADDKHMKAALREALDGLTPYAVDELAFDWAPAGNGRVHVAAVAEQTLAEAEQFAETHRFNPLCFGAIPEPGSFSGEPDFGESGLAHKLLNPGGRVERDELLIDLPAILRRVEQDAPIVTGAPLEVESGPVLAEADDPEVKPGPEATSEPEDTCPDGPEADASDEQNPQLAAPEPAEDEDDATEVVPAEAPEDVPLASEAAATNDPEPEPTFTSTRNALPEKDSAARKPETDTTSTPIAAPPPVMPKPKLSSPISVAQDPPEFVREISLTANRPQSPAQERQAPFIRPIWAMIGLGIAAAILLTLATSYLILGNNDDFDGSELTKSVQTELATTEPADPGPSDAPVARADPELAAVAPEEPDMPESAEPLIDMEIAAIDPSELAEEPDLPEDAAAVEAPAAAVPDVLADPQDAIEADPSEPLAARDFTFLETGPGALAMPGLDRVEDIYIASIDPVARGYDAVALPSATVTAPDTALGAQASPPSFGTIFDLNEQGLVVATPDGTLTPDGILVFAGRPDVVPLPRPGSNAIIETDGLTAERRQALAAFRPVLRPDTLEETDERARFAGLSRTELSGLRPLVRPGGLDAGAPDDTLTEQAIVASLVPLARPSNLPEAIENAIQEAVATAPQPAPAPRSQVPTGASVAQAATVQNGIALNRVALIGVYGSSGNWRALVRLQSGRFVMVRVGDRLDGGRVAAISTEALIYSKNGRNIQLDVPAG